MEQTIDILLENKPGALMRVAGILTAKGCNITSVILEPDPGRPQFSRMTIVADVEARLRVRVVNEMNRLVNVLMARDVSEQQQARVAC